MDSHCKFERDPILDDAHAKLGTLLNKVCVPDRGIGGPVQYQANRAERDSDECKGVEGGDREILILFLPPNDHPDVSQGKQY